jgi:hypothetical protein
VPNHGTIELIDAFSMLVEVSVNGPTTAKRSRRKEGNASTMKRTGNHR